MSGSSSDSGSSRAKRRRSDGDDAEDSADAASGDTLRLARSVCRHIVAAVSQPSVREHRSACRRMVELRDALLKPWATPGSEEIKLLLAAGVTTYRHLNAGLDAHDHADFATTQALLLALIVLCDGRARPPPGHPDDAEMRAPPSPPPPAEGEAGEAEAEGEGEADADPDAERNAELAEARATVATWQTTALADFLFPKQPRSEPPANAAVDDDLPPTCELAPDAVYGAYTTLWVDRHLRPDASPRLTLSQALTDAHAFFAVATVAKQYAMLLQGAPQRPVASDNDFLTLDVVSVLGEANGRDERLTSIVDAGDSEAGQMLLRDFIMSFALPANVVGVRRVPLLSRAASTTATEQHPEILGAAHDAATRGTPWVWGHPETELELHRACALLAGLALVCLPANATADSIRKDDAFGGRVHLPFFQTSTPRVGVSQLCLLPHRREWVLFKWVRNKATPHIILRQGGFDGLCAAVLAMSEERNKQP